MNRTAFIVGTLAAALLSAPAAAQDYWEYDRWENAWELHKPTEGLKYEYENGVEAEEEQYEWEAGEGYHEQEWYDPSDWFNTGRDLDYETDDWSSWYDYDVSPYYGYGGYYPDNTYPGTTNPDNTARNEYQGSAYPDYELDTYQDDTDTSDRANQRRRELRGRVVGLQSVTAQGGRPESVRLSLETEDGQTRVINLGDSSHARWGLQPLRKGERVVVGGSEKNVNGRTMFKVEEIRSREGRYSIPEYQYNRRIEGRLAGMRRVRLRDSDVQALVAKIKTDDGQTREVLLGRLDDLQARGNTLRPGNRVRVEGFDRGIAGRRNFVAQRVRITGDNERDNRRTAGRETERRTSDQQSNSGDSAERRSANQRSADRDARSQSQARQQVQISGEVLETKHARVRGEQRLVVHTRTRQGDRVLLDLGSPDELDMQLEKGDQLTARGIPLRVDGQRILVATTLEHDDQQVRIGR